MYASTNLKLGFASSQAKTVKQVAFTEFVPDVETNDLDIYGIDIDGKHTLFTEKASIKLRFAEVGTANVVTETGNHLIFSKHFSSVYRIYSS